MGQGPTPNPILSFVPLILIFVIFYFLIFRPQKQKQSEHQMMIAGLKKNDEVITVGGIHGTIVNIKDATFVIRVDDEVKIEVEKNSISVLKRSAPAQQEQGLRI
ncbi:MAG TPA: preprotein translocase subunit YajC [Candidatus Omnitrophota bacterium]|nr:preprotein translocase subunit YajC [Candidatus Omnitrophota bacterium]